jgi:hypothetical protein
MTRIYFVGPYTPIMCGIADYTSFITVPLTTQKCAVLSFNLKTYGAPLTTECTAPDDWVWYGIPGQNRHSASAIEKGFAHLRDNCDGAVLWFQHEFGIWPNDKKFVSMLGRLRMPKIVTFHTLHFQSTETPYGLRRREYELLRSLLPHVDAITVFSRGVCNAVISAFPEYRKKAYVMKHGIHSYPDIARMSRREAKQKLNDFLLYESGLPQENKEALHKQRVFLDEHTVVIGQTGFLCPGKSTERLYTVRDRLHDVLPSRRIAAVRIGSPRDLYQATYAARLKDVTNQTDRFLLQTLLPPEILPVAQRAFDINLYWPKDCTQSGIVAHALGAGGIIVGRDKEGTGETLKEAGAPTATHLPQLVRRMAQVVLNPEFADMIEEKALKYSADLSWRNQALRHRALAEALSPAHIESFADSTSLEMASEVVSDIALAHLPAGDLPDQDGSLSHAYGEAERPFVTSQDASMQDAPVA